jgi:hypothetical protein
LSTLEELSDILDAIFRQRVLLTATEAFIDYWNMTYARMQVPKQGWPPAIRHCLSSVGLLPKEAKEEEEESILEPEFATTVPLPHTPLVVSFTTPSAVLKCTTIQSPQRPQKIFGPFPIVPSSPMSPLLRRSIGLSEIRTPLSSIQLCKTPPKRRRLAVDHENGKDEKENVVVSVIDRIAAMNSGAAKKRRYGEMEDEVEKQKSCPPAKKIKSSMRPRTRSASKKASQHASPACSDASSKESEDERQWVEATLRIPFPVIEAQDDACGGGFGTPVPPQRKRHVRTANKVFPYVLIPSKKRTMKPTEREHTTSLDGSGVDDNPSSSSRTLDMRQWPRRLRRSVSIPESMLTSKTEKKRKRPESDAGDSDDESPDLYDLVGSYPLPALPLPLPPPPVRRLRKAYTLPSSDSDVHSTSMSSSSDDDPYIGQVTPRHLISPILQRRSKVVDGSLTSQTRRTPLGMGFGERYGDSMMLPGSDSDDSVITSESETESPTKAQQMKMRMRTLKS